jgi:type VI secretion system secreted protein Hcp
MQFSSRKPEAISSFSWGVSHPATMTEPGRVTGKADFSELTFTKPVTQLSTTLIEGCATGEHFPSVVIVLKDKKGKDYLEIKLVDILISSYHLTGEGDDSTETTSLSYGRIEYVLLGL